MRRTLPIAVLLLVAAAFHARSEERSPLTRETLGGIIKEAYVGDPMLACRVMDDVLRGVDVAALPDDVRAMTEWGQLALAAAVRATRPARRKAH